MSKDFNNLPHITVVSCVYNTKEIASKCIESLLNITTYPKDKWRYVLVYNNPTLKDGSPDQKLKEYIQNIPKLYPENDILIIDKGKNLGCNEGYNAGFKEGSREDTKYLVKLDDDTITMTPNWAELFLKGFEKIQKLVYLSSDIVPKTAKQQHPYDLENLGDGITFEKSRNMVGFGGTVMFLRKFLQKIDYFHSSPHYLTSSDGKIKIMENKDSLYSGEEIYCAQLCNQYGYVHGYYPPVVTGHQDNEERDRLYILWKFYYGFLNATRKDLSEIKKDKNELINCIKECINFKLEHYARFAIEEAIDSKLVEVKQNVLMMLKDAKEQITKDLCLKYLQIIEK